MTSTKNKQINKNNNQQKNKKLYLAASGLFMLAIDMHSSAKLQKCSSLQVRSIAKAHCA